MLRKALLVTTALVLGASVAYAGTVHHGLAPKTQNHPKFLNLAGHLGAHGMFPITMFAGHTQTQPVHNNTLRTPKKGSTFSKEVNAQWISWYGYTAINEDECSSISSNYHYCDFEAGNNAAAVTGIKKASSITVPLFSETGSTTQYEVGIYSATASGLPGAALATGTFTGASDNEYCCNNARTATLSGQSKFDKSKTYFVELSCGTNSSECDGGWNMEDVDFTGATVDYWHVSGKYTTYIDGTQYSDPFSSPWHESTEYPTAGAFAIN